MQLDRRAFLTAFGALALPSVAAATSADAGAPLAYTQPAFEAAQKAGRLVLIDIFATWCDVCARQAPVLEKLLGDSSYKDLVIFKVNYDTQKDVMRKFNAPLQSTLIAYRGSKELGRLVGETQPEWIEDLLSKGNNGNS